MIFLSNCFIATHGVTPCCLAKNVLTLCILTVAHFVTTVGTVTTQHLILHLEILRAPPFIVSAAKVTFTDVCFTGLSRRKLKFYTGKVQKHRLSKVSIYNQSYSKDPFCTDVPTHSHTLLHFLPPCYHVVSMGYILKSQWICLTVFFPCD